MAGATCSQCGEYFHWYGGRGRKLADATSPCCNAPGKGRTADTKRKNSFGIMVSLRSRTLLGSTWETQWLAPDKRKAIYENGAVKFWYKYIVPTETVVNGWRMFVERGYTKPSYYNYFLMLEDDWMRLQTDAKAVKSVQSYDSLLMAPSDLTFAGPPF